MHARSDDLDGNRVVVLSAGGLTAVVVPDIGAKIVSLVSERSGREFIWRDPNRPLRPVTAGSAYADNDASGVDDCFPTIDACRYPTVPFHGLQLGDHGDLWSRQWGWRCDGDGAVFRVTGTTLPFRFEKVLRIHERTRTLLVENELYWAGVEPFHYQWTAHPLLRAEKGMLIDLPAGRVAWTAFATGGRLVDDAVSWDWPHAPGLDGALRDVSRVGEPDDGVNEKYWLSAPDGGCLLRFEGTDEQLRVGYDPAVPTS